MAYDVETDTASFPTEQFTHLVNMSAYTPIGYNLEPELKFSLPITKPKTVSIHTSYRKDMLVEREEQQAFYLFRQLAKSFNHAAKEGMSTIDRNGAHPRDYILVSLGQDTLSHLPTLKIRQCGHQYRERFALSIVSGSAHTAKYEANAKTLLSESQNGRHRQEFEITCGTPSQSYQTFRQIADLPEFFHEIDPDTLFVDSICMTARSCFFSLTHIQETGIAVLLEHSCDISRFTTPHTDVFTNKHLDCEWESEVKGFYGEDDRLNSREGQQELVNMLFSHLQERMSQKVKGLSLNTKSKMERAAISVSDYYEKNGPSSIHSSILKGYCADRNIPLGLAYSLAQRIRARDIYSKIPTSLKFLVSDMPEPENILYSLHKDRSLSRECA